MSASGPFGAGEPFEGFPFFADLARMLSQQGPVSWDAARQLALSVATAGEAETNVDPLDRIQFESLARVADLHVGTVTGLSTSATGQPISILPVTRSQWVLRTLDAYRPHFEGLAAALAAAGGNGRGGATGEAAEAGVEAWLGGVMQALTPVVLGMTAGSMIGRMAVRSFGQYDLPIPRPPAGEIAVIARNIDEFGRDWLLDVEELRLWVCLQEVAYNSVLAVEHVRAGFEELLGGYIAAFEPDPRALEERLGQFDPTDPSGMTEMQSLLSDPHVLVGAIRSPAQDAVRPRLEALAAAIVGYVDWVMDTTGTKLMGSYAKITEATRRSRVEAPAAERFAGALLGLDLDQACYDRGRAFVDGIIERAGSEGLDRLWGNERFLPTPAEVDAPGLWLARIELPD